jgi:hemerythrin-like metal-binding protein
MPEHASVLFLIIFVSCSDNALPAHFLYYLQRKGTISMPDSSDRHILGLPEMDAQHDYLYSLFDSIEDSFRHSGRQSAAMLLEEIERYLLFHFESEELLMRRYGFPEFAAHQSDHEAAGDRLVLFQNDFQADALNPSALRIFLTGWLMEHSVQSDSGYAEWVKKTRDRLGSFNKHVEDKTA